jgi:hypothetical protein
LFLGSQPLILPSSSCRQSKPPDFRKDPIARRGPAAPGGNSLPSSRVGRYRLQLHSSFQEKRTAASPACIHQYSCICTSRTMAVVSLGPKSSPKCVQLNGSDNGREAEAAGYSNCWWRGRTTSAQPIPITATATQYLLPCPIPALPNAILDPQGIVGVNLMFGRTQRDSLW